MREEETRISSSNRLSGIRAFIEPRCLSPLNLNIPGRRSSYLKLPPQNLIKLSIIKLDGSLFDIQIAGNVTVLELKQSIEEVFTMSPKEGQGRISWSHVWGHFCLCYQGQKLIHDKQCIRNYGIKDGDQLHFIRHLSMDHYPLNKRSKSQSCKHYLESQSGVRNAYHENNDKNRDNGDRTIENHPLGPESEPKVQDKFKLAHFLKGWISYSRLWGGSSRTGRSQDRSRPSRFSLECLGGRPKIIQL